MTCELHEPTEKICNYCFSCDKLEFDGRIWVPEEQFQQAQAERDALEEQLQQMQAERDALVIERDKLLDLSMELDEHPEDYDGPCMCTLCRSYGD